MNRTIILNAVLFQIGWFACVLGGNQIAVPVTLAILIAHWFLVSKQIAEWRTIFLVALVGIIIDSGLFAAGVFNDGSERHIAPLWLIGLWLLFATTLNHSFSWLHQRYVLAIVLGAISGPLSYLAGVKLGAVSFGIEQVSALLLLALIWAVLFPVSLFVATANRSLAR
jgi:hypothetical protein